MSRSRYRSLTAEKLRGKRIPSWEWFGQATEACWLMACDHDGDGSFADIWDPLLDEDAAQIAESLRAGGEDVP